MQVTVTDYLVVCLVVITAMAVLWLRKNTNASWLQVEMSESITLLRNKLEEMNDMDVDDLDSEDICDIKNIYKSLYYILAIHKSIEAK